LNCCKVVSKDVTIVVYKKKPYPDREIKNYEQNQGMAPVRESEREKD